MEARLNMAHIQPAAYKALNVLDQFMLASSIDPLHREMIKIRASQINGCAYCISHHTASARKLGETEQRIYLMSAWREAGDIFTEEERLLLDMTEQVTLVHKAGLKDETYDKVLEKFGKEQTAQIIMGIITINAWNRVGVSLNMHPVL